MTKTTTKGSAPKGVSGNKTVASPRRAAKLDLSEPLFELLEECPDILGAVVATGDGHLIDSFARSEGLPEKELAAMSSTLMALGDTLSRTLDQGICRNVLVENEQGTTLLLHAGEGMALMAAAVPDARLGLVLSHSRRTADAIAAIAAQSKRPGARSAA